MGSELIQIEQLEGTGNQSYKLTLQNDVVVLRLNADTRVLGVDRQREKRILEAIAERGITPALRIWRENFLVVKFINSSPTFHLRHTVNALHILHTTPVPIEYLNTTPWTPVQTIQDYLMLVPEAANAVARHLEVLQVFDWSSLAYAMCHIDLNPGNILQPIDGGPTLLIDWEYARYGPIAYDFAVYCETHGVSPESIDRLRAMYPQPPSRNDIAICQLAYRVIEQLWFRITKSVGQNKVPE